MRLFPAILIALLCCSMLQGCRTQGKTEPPARLTLLVSGNTMGYLRNCGCASGQYGGELRRARLLKQEREEALKPRPADKGRDPAVLVLDQGSILGGTEYIDRLYSRQVLKSMASTDYEMIGLGESDLQFGQADLQEYLQAAADTLSEGGLPLTAVNLHFEKPAAGPDLSRELNEMIQKYRIVKLENGYRIGLIHAIDPGVTFNLDDDLAVTEKYGFSVLPVAKATEQVLDQHGSEADFWIFSLSDGIQGVTDPKQIADLEDLDLVIGFTGGNPNQTALSGEVVFPFFVKGPILKARDLVKITVNFPAQSDGDLTVTAQQLAVGSNIKGDEVVLGLIEEIWPEIETWEKDKLDKQVERLQPQIVGQRTCATCHANIFQAMQTTRHQQAYQSLIERAASDPEQKNADKDSSCLRCHVTLYISPHGGWNKLDKQEDLAMVSCESCHGPGQYHVQIRSGLDPPEDLQMDGRDENGLLPAGPETCLTCHDAENSPKFNFDEYWSRIEHSLDMPKPDITAEPDGH